MKTLNITATLLLLGTFTLGMSDTIDQQISAIQATTTSEQRVSLMNEFKTNIATMSAEDQSAAINQLRTTMLANHDDALVGAGVGAQTGVGLGLGQRAGVAQMRDSSEIQESQRMNQGRAASQYVMQNPDIIIPEGSVMTPGVGFVAPDGTITAPATTVPDGSIMTPGVGIVAPDGTVVSQTPSGGGSFMRR